jgi:signal transduction histidine kinase
LHNTVKHAQANNVSVIVEVKEYLKITVCDDGVGFNHSEIRPFSNGIFNIEKRMREIDGTSEITSIKGTTVILKAPLS